MKKAFLYIIWLVAIMLACGSDIGIAAAEADAADIADFGVKYLIVMFVFRFIAETINLVSKRTKNKWDNKLAKYITIGLDLMAKAFAKMGFGTQIK